MKISLRSLYIFLVLLIFGGGYEAAAQFYNGHQMSFGKNRVQYREYYWQFYRFDQYDVYYHTESKEIAEYASLKIDEEMDKMQDFFEQSLQNRIIFLVYNNLSSFRQSNIGLISGNENYNTGGVTKIIDNKVFLYYEGDRDKFDQQISAAIAEVLFNEKMYGGSMRERMTSSTLLTVPDWYSLGLLAYVSEDWNFETENRVKDGILSGKYKRINQLTGDDAMYAGHSIWYFIAETYGKAVIPNILYMTKINKNIESGFMFVLGMSLKTITPQWIDFYTQRYGMPEDSLIYPKKADETVRVKKRHKTEIVYQNVCTSPDDRYVAYVTNELGKYRVWLLDTETGKTKKVIKDGHKLDQITDYSYPALAWHPKNGQLSMIVEEKAHMTLYTYDPLTEELQDKRLLYLDKVLDFSYSSTGMRFVCSGMRKGLTDIFVYDLPTNTIRQVTQDLADDFNPHFINNSSQIVFSSNRTSDTLTVEDDIHSPREKTTDLFIYDYKNDSKVLTRLTRTPYYNETQAFETGINTYIYLSDESGVVNRKMAKFDSTIAYVDTTTHYRYFSLSDYLSDYPRNILEQYINPQTKTLSEIVFMKGKFYLYLDQLDATKIVSAQQMPPTDFREYRTEQLIWLDSLENRKKTDVKVAPIKTIIRTNKDSVVFVHPDSVLVDIRKYVFENEKIQVSAAGNYLDSLQIPEEEEFVIPHPKVSLTTFYIDELINQVDFGFLSETYQPYTDNAFYFNPGFNVLMRVGLKDLFEDYKLTGAMRFPGNFESSEYLLSAENLKTRLDKQYVYHRQALINTTEDGYSVKAITHQFMYLMKYPLSQVAAFSLTLSSRYERNIVLSTDHISMNEPGFSRTWAGAKGEYIFDNTRSLGVNLYEGSRIKIFAEAHKQIDGARTDLFVFGADFRHYTKIHRNLIWANRFATSTSLGHSRLMYYMGAVDNWYNVFGRVPTFRTDIDRNKQINWVYQAVATNMRGFQQNVRNGNTFALVNSELRWPIVRYLANRPLNNDFLNNLQVIGFFDAGAAWTGKSPLDEKNAYNTETIENGPITVIIDKERAPVVMGYGFGLRSRLFGYFIRTDWAWGIDGDAIVAPVFYLSLSLDF